MIGVAFLYANKSTIEAAAAGISQPIWPSNWKLNSLNIPGCPPKDGVKTLKPKPLKSEV